MKPVALLLPLLFCLATCYNFDNPVDPAAASYQAPQSGSEWLSGWSQRKRIEFAPNQAGALVSYPVRFTVHYGSGTDAGDSVYLNARCQSRFDDVRFTDADGESLLSYWVQESTEADCAVLWVKIPAISESEGAVAYCYYGNPSAFASSSGENTFPFFDDFESAGIDTGKWEGDTDEASGGWYTAGGVAVCGSSGKIIYSRQTYSDLECLSRIKIDFQTKGFLCVRVSIESEPPAKLDRYDLYIDSESVSTSLGFYLRRLITGIETIFDSKYFYFYDQDYFFAALDAVGSGGAGNNLYGQAVSAAESVSLSASDTAHTLGRVGFGIEMVNSGSMYVDWFAVRPKSLPEPTIDQWGEEES